MLVSCNPPSEAARTLFHPTRGPPGSDSRPIAGSETPSLYVCSFCHAGQRPTVREHRMRIGIMGIGYVGLPLAVAFAEQGHDVIGVDVDPRKTEALTRGESYIEDIPSPRLQAVAHRLDATTRAANLSRCDAVLVCVPTPLTANREPD